MNYVCAILMILLSIAVIYLNHKVDSAEKDAKRNRDYYYNQGIMDAYSEMNAENRLEIDDILNHTDERVIRHIDADGIWDDEDHADLIFDWPYSKNGTHCFPIDYIPEVKREGAVYDFYNPSGYVTKELICSGDGSAWDTYGEVKL